MTTPVVRDRGPGPRRTGVGAGTVVGVCLLISSCGHGGSRVVSDHNSTTGGGPKPSVPRDAYTGNQYRNPGVNAFVESSVDPMSAFAADVDTGSYTVARKYVADGNRPHPDSVRVEEYVNYFDQGYAAPATGTFALHADGAPSPFVQDAVHNRVVRLGVRAKDVTDTTRRNASLTFVVDTSGSMEQGGRLELVKQSLRMLVDELGTGDRVAIVAFGDNSTVVLASTPASDRRAILDGIDRLRIGGSTNAEAGLRTGYTTAQTGYMPGGTNRVILASDGVANVGTTGADALASQVRAAAAKGIQLVTLGVGMGNYNDVLMEQLADKGDGFYAYIDSLGEAQRLFRERLMTTIEPVALDANIGVVWDKDKVVRYRLLGFENRSIPDMQVNAPAVDGGEVNAGHTVTALYEISLAPGAVLAPDQQIGMFGIRWVDPQTKALDGLMHPVTAGDLAPSWEAASPRLRLDATVAQYADVLRNNPYASRFTLTDVARISDGLPRELPQDPDVAEFADLVRRASGSY